MYSLGSLTLDFRSTETILMGTGMQGILCFLPLVYYHFFLGCCYFLFCCCFVFNIPFIKNLAISLIDSDFCQNIYYTDLSYIKSETTIPIKTPSITNPFSLKAPDKYNKPQDTFQNTRHTKTETKHSSQTQTQITLMYLN